METKEKVPSYRELIVWQKSINLVLKIYAVTEKFPKSEVYGLTSQMKRASVSIPSNIAEGRSRGTRKDFKHFLVMAFGSGAELETQIEIAKKLNYVSDQDVSEVSALLVEVAKMLNVMIRKISE